MQTRPQLSLQHIAYRSIRSRAKSGVARAPVASTSRSADLTGDTHAPIISPRLRTRNLLRSLNAVVPRVLDEEVERSVWTARVTAAIEDIGETGRLTRVSGELVWYSALVYDY